jgi:hypothetical protein
MAKRHTSDDETKKVSQDLSSSVKTAIEKNEKVFVPRKELPSVQYLLVHGDPETAHLPKTWCEVIGYPLAMAAVFAISLLLFHHAPHHLLPPRKKYSIPGIQRLPLFQKNGHPTPPLHRHPAAKVTTASDNIPEEKTEISEL